MKALVTGATGFVGRRLVERLIQPVVLSRDVRRAELRFAAHDVCVRAWNPMNEPPPPDAFEGVQVVFHLAGEPIAEGRWTAEKKRRIRESRVIGTRNLVDTLLRLPTKPDVLVSASAVGFYGDRGDELLPESASPGSGFLPQTCVEWERESLRAQETGIRVVNPRVGIVLGPGGGAIGKMETLFRLGLGAPLGSGRQWMPWIHLEDLLSLMLMAAEREDLTGPINAAAPFPVTNSEFTKALGRAVQRPTILPSVPGMVLRFGIGEMADALLGSQRVVPQAAEKAGFEFRYKTIDAALGQIFA